jgi:hypothetical protein
MIPDTLFSLTFGGLMKFVLKCSVLLILLVLATLESRPVLGQDQGVIDPATGPPPNPLPLQTQREAL